MAHNWLPDELWEEIEPLLPKKVNVVGRPRVPDRQCLLGIIFVLRTGCAWRALPAELGCGSGVTCWRRLQEWKSAGVFAQIHGRFLAHLRREGRV